MRITRDVDENIFVYTRPWRTSKEKYPRKPKANIKLTKTKELMLCTFIASCDMILKSGIVIQEAPVQKASRLLVVGSVRCYWISQTRNWSTKGKVHILGFRSSSCRFWTVSLSIVSGNRNTEMMEKWIRIKFEQVANKKGRCLVFSSCFLLPLPLLFLSFGQCQSGICPNHIRPLWQLPWQMPCDKYDHLRSTSPPWHRDHSNRHVGTPLERQFRECPKRVTRNHSPNQSQACGISWSWPWHPQHSPNTCFTSCNKTQDTFHRPFVQLSEMKEDLSFAPPMIFQWSRFLFAFPISIHFLSKKRTMMMMAMIICSIKGQHEGKSKSSDNGGTELDLFTPGGWQFGA